MIRPALVVVALLATGAALAAPARAAPVLSPVWGDHAVIQRGQPIVVEGTAAAGERIAATFGSERAAATAGADGAFRLTFPARPASAHPLTLTVTGVRGSVTVSDIVIGDVWLCSGQSNMAMTVSATLNGDNLIAASADPLLRMLNVPLETSPRPERAFSQAVQWQAASPETTGTFSAACYAMLRDLRAELGVPMGAVHASWGGAQIRAWLTPQGGTALYGAEQMALLKTFSADPLGAAAAFAPLYESWWRESTGQKPWSDPSTVDWLPVPQISVWNQWTGTTLAKNANGNVLLRRTIDLTPAQAAVGGTLNIGIIDDIDATWINGRPLGFTHGWSTEREYSVPPAYLQAGANEVLVIASNSYATGGFTSPAERLCFAVTGGRRIPLGEGWLYAIGTESGSPRAPWDANAGIGVMHNRMVAPLGNIPLAGAAWYQGESDVGIPGYGERLRELFAGWRGQFGPQLRVLVVQLADYGPTAAQPVASGWAELREAQRRAVVADSNAALVTAIDIGERTDIHPANKPELGRRLALAARGEALPMPRSATSDGEWVRVRFDRVASALQSWSGPPLAFGLCADTQDSCRFARATIQGADMLLFTDGQPASRVRYAWADSPVVNTYDERDLPLPGFELEIEP